MRIMEQTATDVPFLAGVQATAGTAGVPPRWVALVVLAMLMVALMGTRALASDPKLRASRELSPAEVATVAEHIFAGRSDQALELLASLHDECADAPLFYILRARIYRERLPIDDERKDVIERRSQAILADLDTAIRLCDAAIDADDPNPNYLLYRGWAWMAKSHTRSFARAFWSAGRDAGKGKRDLVAYLELRPDDPVANSVLGAFLYFADTIPNLFKFFSKLLRFPGGDRDEGLDRMRRGIAAGGPFLPEHELLLYSTYFLFEGRYEDGADGVLSVLKRHRNYVRANLPMAIMGPFVPGRRAEFQAAVADGIARSVQHSSDHNDTNTHYVLRFESALANALFGDVAAAEREFYAITSEKPKHPDWVVAYSRCELARLAAAQGRFDAAMNHLRLAREQKIDLISGDIEALEKEIKGYTGPPPNRPIDPRIVAIYEQNPTNDRPDWLASASEGGFYKGFYRAENDFIAGRWHDAIAGYREIIETPRPTWDDRFKLVAGSRIGESWFQLGDYDRAGEALEEAMQHYRHEFLVDWLLDNRRGYFQRVRDRDSRE